MLGWRSSCSFSRTDGIFDFRILTLTTAFALGGAVILTPLAAAQTPQDPWSSPGVTVIDTTNRPGGQARPRPSPPVDAPTAVDPAAPAPAPPAPIIPNRASADQLSVRYREILSSWVAGNVDKAPDDLMALEVSVVAEGDPKSRKRLLEAEQAVIHELGGQSLEVLVPLAMLHHETYIRHLERSRRPVPLALLHARSMARDLVIRYNEQAATEGSAVVASRVLTSLGGLMLDHSQHIPAAELFYQAIQLDSRNTGAMLGLATAYEKSSQAASTVKTLRDLLAVDPTHAEARLRLALNLRRLEQPDEKQARRILEELVAASDASWVSALAHQELARTHSRNGDHDDAEKVLRKALERFPQDHRFHVQLAAVLDRRGSVQEGRDLVEKAAELPPLRTESSRLLYNIVRPDMFAEARMVLADSMRSRLPVLAQALGTPIGSREAGR